MADPAQPFVIDDIRTKTNEVVLKAQTTLPTAVSERLAQEVIKEREQLLYDGVKKYDELRKEVSKAGKPDAVTQQREPDGSWKKIEQFSDAGAKKLREAEDRLTKFKAAYAKALDKEKPDYEPLKKVLKGGGGQQTEESAGSSE